MKQELEAFLSLRLPLPGLAAWGARLADRSMASRSFAPSLAARQIEQTVTKLTQAAEQLADHRIQPVRFCWVFEHLRIHVALRREGHCLALFVENRPGLASTALDGLLDDFVNLPAL